MCVVAWLFVAGCACDGGVPGDQVACDSDGDCAQVTPPAVCDLNLGVCVPAGTDGGTVDGGGGGDGGVVGPDCTAAVDCETAFGAPPCGAWACNAGFCEVECAGCTDNDKDGYGPEAACAGPDCDDFDDTIEDTASRACYSGPPGTDGVGTCLAGIEACRGGVWTPCTGQVVPSGEACNTEDDDCDGSTDEDLGLFVCGQGACESQVNACTNGTVGQCVPGTPATAVDGPACDGVDDDCDGGTDEDCSACVHVTPSGNDATGDGSAGAPYASVSWAIAQAEVALATGAGPQKVCVAGGPSCAMTHTYATGPGQPLVMADGVSVYGSYESAGWTRCGGWTTGLRPGDARGVVFDISVQQPTVLDGFQIRRFNAPTTAGVTVDGSPSAVIANVFIDEIPPVTEAYGVNVVNGGDAIVTRSLIVGGRGTATSVGVRAAGARVQVENNCQSLDGTGACDDACNGRNNLGIRGQFDWQFTQGEAYAVHLDDAPGSQVEGNALCAASSEHGAMVRIEGNGTGVLIRGNHMDAWGGTLDSHGVWAEDCGGGRPWIVDNFRITAFSDRSGSRADGVRSVGDCHVIVDQNRLIRGGAESSNPSDISAVYCGANRAGLASRCVVLGNFDIRGVTFGFPTTAAGVRCDDGACNRIANNRITGVSGEEVYGIYLGATGTFVDANVIIGGCPQVSAAGIHSQNSWARIQNNVVFAGNCGNTPVTAPYYGLRVVTEAGGNEVDVHSNLLDGEGDAVACTSAGVSLETGAAPPGVPVGIFRNNIVRGGNCATSYGVVEADVDADPRLFEHNDLDPAGPPSALYRDEGASDVNDPTQVGTGNLSADPAFVAYPSDVHLLGGGSSPCENAGTPDGAPAWDFEYQTRDAQPDIGPDEL